VRQIISIVLFSFFFSLFFFSVAQSHEEDQWKSAFDRSGISKIIANILVRKYADMCDRSAGILKTQRYFRFLPV
jgi:MFS-type transporter involved in bile tolerance (Atg22 family)